MSIMTATTTDASLNTATNASSTTATTNTPNTATNASLDIANTGPAPDTTEASPSLFEMLKAGIIFDTAENFMSLLCEDDIRLESAIRYKTSHREDLYEEILVHGFMPGDVHPYTTPLAFIAGIQDTYTFMRKLETDGDIEIVLRHNDKSKVDKLERSLKLEDLASVYTQFPKEAFAWTWSALFKTESGADLTPPNNLFTTEAVDVVIQSLARLVNDRTVTAPKCTRR